MHPHAEPKANSHPESGPVLPLAGVRVIELAQNLAGPFASQILASMGADVIKIERPEGGDDARGWGPPFWQGAATAFHAMNHDKRGITLDLKDPQAIAWLKDRIAESDVLVQNLRPGVLDEMGLDAKSLSALNPRLIYCSLLAFGNKGPMKLQPGYEPMIQAFSGMFSVNGTEDGPSARVGMPVLDLGTGLWAALGCVAALYRRQSTGVGGVVDTSLFETALGWLNVIFAAYGVTGKQPERHRSGNAKLVVFQSFETSDGEIVVAAANDRLFAKLCKALGHPEWSADSRFATNALRVEHKPVILPLLEVAFRQQSCEHWLEKLEAVGVPAAPIHDLQDVMNQPQAEAIGIFQKAPQSDLSMVGLPLSFEGQRPAIRRPAPTLGEHNVELGLAPLAAATTITAKEPK